MISATATTGFSVREFVAPAPDVVALTPDKGSQVFGAPQFRRMRRAIKFGVAAAAVMTMNSSTSFPDHTATRKLAEISRPATTKQEAKGRVSASSPSYQEDRNVELSAQIIAYAGLDGDWDGDGGLPPQPWAIDAALSFIDLMPLGAKPTGSMVEGTGEVGFYWKTPASYIDITFRDGQILYYGRANKDGTTKEAKGAEPFDFKSVPADLLAVITHA